MVTDLQIEWGGLVCCMIYILIWIKLWIIFQ